MRPHGTQLRPRRAGLTLAELSVSLAVIATLMVAIGSVMVLTGRAVGMTASQATEAKIDDVLATIASEQRMALTITDLSPTTVTFTVADRDNDGFRETIKYSWAGPGQPLLRTYNAGTPKTVLAAVQKFQMGYLTKSAAGAMPVPEVESTTDQLLFAHETGGSNTHTMSLTTYCAQSFKPSLRADATSWRVTQVQIMATRTGTGTGKSWTLSLCPTDALGKPNTLAPIETKTLPMTSLGASAGWSPIIAFTGAHNLDPTQRYWLVVSQGALTTTGSVVYDPSSSDTADPFATSTLTTVWTTYPGRDMKIRVYGRYKYPQP